MQHCIILKTEQISNYQIKIHEYTIFNAKCNTIVFDF